MNNHKDNEEFIVNVDRIRERMHLIETCGDTDCDEYRILKALLEKVSE